MAKKRKAPKPEGKLPVDPNAPVFQVGDEIVVKRRLLWTGYQGRVVSTDGGMCRCRIYNPKGLGDSVTFLSDIPAAELALDL